MSGHVGNLSPKQEEILSEFRGQVVDLLQRRPSWDDDYFLTRWLRARQYNVELASAMLRHHDKWRIEHGVDTILQDFTPPEVVKKYFTGGLFGQDKEGALIWMEPIGNIDLKGLLMSSRKKEIILAKIQLLESFFIKFEEKTKEQGRRVDQVVTVFDLEKLGMRHLWKPGVEVITSIVDLYEDHYPEVLKKTYAVNAPAFFPIAYRLLRPFLSEATHNKLVVLGSNYRETLLQHIEADQLPKHWGGMCTDPDGNGRCPSVINQGGEVPRDYYRNNTPSDTSSFTDIVVRRKSSLQLDYEVDKIPSVLRWQFTTNGYDIGFGLSFTNCSQDQNEKSSNMDTVLTSLRVNSHLVPEEGSHLCQKIGTYSIRFDNTFSLVRSKRLSYLIEVLEP